jgi:multiple sugar transport system ATP-binding protein
MAKLVVEGLSKAFDGQTVIAACDVEVSDGEFLVLLGPSGCGKSTLLRIIAGLESADSGTVRIGDRDVTNHPPRDRDVAMVFQNYALYPHMTVYNNIAFPLRMKRQDRSDIDHSVRHTAELLGLTELLSRKPRTLSGGQRQRVAVGRAIVRNPKLFLFDEPLSNLDAELRISMRSEIKRLMQSLGATAVYVTHDQEEALTMGDRIAILYQGLFQQVGTPRQVFEKPSCLFVAQFIGTPRMNILRARYNGNSGLKIADDLVIECPTLSDVTDETELMLGFRPDDCRMIESGGIPVEVVSTEYLGESSYVHGLYGDTEIIVHLRSQTTPAPGDVIRVLPDPESIHLFDAASNRVSC